MIKDTVVNGCNNAPHRSLYNALGLTAEELQKPLIGIVCSYNEIVPGHMHLDKIAEAVKLGVGYYALALLFAVRLALLAFITTLL